MIENCGQVHDRARRRRCRAATTGGPSRPWPGSWPATASLSASGSIGTADSKIIDGSSGSSVTSSSPSAGSSHCGAPSGSTTNSRSGSGLTSRLISGWTSRIELAITNGARVARSNWALAFSGLMISGSTVAVADAFVDQGLGWRSMRIWRGRCHWSSRLISRCRACSATGRPAAPPPGSGPAAWSASALEQSPSSRTRHALRSGDSPFSRWACATRATETRTPSMPRSSEVGENGVTDSASTWA